MTSTATANPVLQGFYSEFMREGSGFVAEAIAPTFNSGEQSAQYYVWDKENLLMVPKNIERAPGAPHVEISMRLSDDTYFCRNYGVKSGVPDEIRKKYRVALDADAAAVRRVVDTIKINRELRVKAKATNTALVPNASPSIKWNDAGCNPRTDVDAGKEAIRLGMGKRANTMIISEPVRLILSQSPEIRKAFQLSIAGAVTLEMMKIYFEIPKIVIADEVIATNVEGQATTAADIWGDDILLAHVEPGQDMMLPNFMRTFNWIEAGNIEGNLISWREDDRKTDMHASDHSTDEKLTSSAAGYLLNDVLA